MANGVRQQRPLDADAMGVAALDAYVWRPGYRAVAVIGASCLDWCRFARDCAGEGAYARHLKNKK